MIIKHNTSYGREVSFLKLWLIIVLADTGHGTEQWVNWPVWLECACAVLVLGIGPTRKWPNLFLDLISIIIHIPYSQHFTLRDPDYLSIQ